LFWINLQHCGWGKNNNSVLFSYRTKPHGQTTWSPILDVFQSKIFFFFGGDQSKMPIIKRNKPWKSPKLNNVIHTVTLSHKLPL
jgi:hypothetical protein